ncbi:MAG: DNA-3-methyladenine glycosylase [Planctomycetes bacterium]|nr:DNA-3-methyladenine glycosylase [Planctomycetota bacterium]MBL7038885.1 DNA-3-methyladenine glycosylase [Pirellulaceae bacterium]
MATNPLRREFYDRDPVEVAMGLLGNILVHQSVEGTVTGRIVETEAYLAKGDSACHAARGRNRKNASMFGPPGRAYVYPIHARYCFNVVTEPEDVASAVLVRAVEPLDGISLMKQRRVPDRLREIANGPAKLCEAFDIDRVLDGWDLTRGVRFWIERDGDFNVGQFEVGRSERIGVTSAHDLPLRFFFKGNEFVSGPKRMRT